MDLKNWEEDPIVRRFGGLYHPDTSNETDQWIIQQLHQVYNQNTHWLDPIIDGVELDQVDLIVTAGDEVNALAYRIGQKRAIILPMGLLRTLWQSLVIAAHTPNVLSVACPLPEAATQYRFTPEAHPADWTIPQARTDFLMHVYCFMLEYITMHELAHHTRGHLDQQHVHNNGSALLDEQKQRNIPIKTSAAVSERDREFDADVAGLNLSLNTFNNRFPFTDTWEEYDALELLFLMVFSQLLVAQQLDAIAEPQRTTPEQHPAPLYRCINFANLITRNLYRLVGGEWARYCDQHDAAWSEASFLAEQLNLPQRYWYEHDIESQYLSDFLIQESDFFAAAAKIDGAVTNEEKP